MLFVSELLTNITTPMDKENCYRCRPNEKYSIYPGAVLPLCSECIDNFVARNEIWEEDLRLKVNFDKNVDREVCILFIHRLLDKQRLKIREEIEEAHTDTDCCQRETILELPSLNK